ncbi:hypothetical protein T492DRAFT_846823 [Pavlovales sp. CCMP2436]|nr:hypothetical protein T492DRAFT_846823 [Pavlovales sp. CCMP2436]
MAAGLQPHSLTAKLRELRGERLEARASLPGKAESSLTWETFSAGTTPSAHGWRDARAQFRELCQAVGALLGDEPGATVGEAVATIYAAASRVAARFAGSDPTDERRARTLAEGLAAVVGASNVSPKVVLYPFPLFNETSRTTNNNMNEQAVSRLLQLHSSLEQWHAAHGSRSSSATSSAPRISQTATPGPALGASAAALGPRVSGPVRGLPASAGAAPLGLGISAASAPPGFGISSGPSSAPPGLGISKASAPPGLGILAVSASPQGAPKAAVGGVASARFGRTCRARRNRDGTFFFSPLPLPMLSLMLFLFVGVHFGSHLFGVARAAFP